MSEQNYGELFCEAVDTIVKQRLQGVAFDQTVLCTIIDDSKREQGIYKVSNGSSQFEAYSSITDYRNNRNVYVQIPQGDWNSQKFIIGKKNKNDVEEAFVYKNPFSSLVDITGNLVKADTSSYAQSALIANHPDKQEIVIWSYNLKKSSALYQNSGIKLSSYTRLGIQAQFQSWLNPYPVSETKSDEYGPIEYTTRMENVIEGNYGLKLRVLALQDNIAGEDQEFTPYEFQLNTNDMNGNPYNFQTFFQQEKLFDISDLREISSMELVFYQDAGTFMNDKKEKRPYQNNFFGESQEIEPNLFVKDIYISLGYGTEEFDEEMVNIYTLQSSNYVRTAEPFEDNHRRIELRWIHKQRDGSFKSITEQNNDLDFQVRWYRYSLGAPSADEYSDVYWTALSRQYIDEKTKKFEYDIQDEDWKKYNEQQEKAENRREPGFFCSWILPDVALQTEQIKAVIIYNNKPYRSNVLVLRNEDEVVSRPTVDAIQALTINCEDGTYGNYRIYAEGNQLINPADSSVRREFKLYFKSEYENTQPDEETGSYELVEARALEWVIPSTNTMIRLPKDWEDLAKKGGPADGAQEKLEDDSNGGETDIFFWTDELGNYHIKRFGWKDPNDDSAVYQIYNKQPYYISSYYSEQYSNNTISCTIEKEPNTFYTATKPLTFGIAGTTGTDVTLVIDFQNVSIHAIDIEDSEKYAQIFVANLYDSENKNVTEDAIEKGCTFTWGWLGDSSKGTILSNDGRNLLYKISDSLGVNKCEVYFANTPTEIDRTSWNILACTVTGWGDYDLVAFLPIPLKRKVDNCSPAYIQGTQRIIYNSEGNPSYYKGPYELYCSENYGEPNTTTNISWEMSYDETDENKKYYPQIFTEIKDADGNTINSTPYLQYSLKALNLYVKDSSDGINVLCLYNDGQENSKDIVVWSQPLLIMQNRYPSAMLNKWDGSLTIDENNNSILAAKVAAGRKNDDNTFSGVLMGDVKEDLGSTDSYIDSKGNSVSGVDSTTGLYGFNRGAMSFGFRDNGTAFIGKSGRGRILFDGNSGVIKSSLWDEDESGLYMDIDDAELRLQKDADEIDESHSSNFSKVALVKNQYVGGKYYYLREYVPFRHNDEVEEGTKYYGPILYEEVELSGKDYKVLMSDVSQTPKFYQIEWTIEGPDSETEGWKPPAGTESDLIEKEDGKAEVDTGFQDPWGESENNDTISVEVIKGKRYVLITEDDSQGKTDEEIVTVYIPTAFEETQKLDGNDWYYYNIYDEYIRKQEQNPEEEIEPPTPQKSDKDSIFDPTLTYYKENIYIEDITDANGNTIAENVNRRYITLSANQNLYPLAIGAKKALSSRKFRVTWDGTVYIEDGVFSGEINATSGTLGNLRVLGTLVGGTVSGAQISGSQIKGSRVQADYLLCFNGNIGGWYIGNNFLRGGNITMSSSGGGTITGGTIKGTKIYGTEGQLGGWYITKSTFQNKDNKTTDDSQATIRLNSQDGSIQGGILRTTYKLLTQQGDINPDEGGMILDGFLRIADPTSTSAKPIAGSYFGYLKANTGVSYADESSDGLGMQMISAIPDNSGGIASTTVYRVITTDTSAGISVFDNSNKARTNNISIQSGQIDFTAAKTNDTQFASFATGNYKMGAGGSFSYAFCPIEKWTDSSGTHLPGGNTGDFDYRLEVYRDSITIGSSFKNAVSQGGFHGNIYIGNDDLYETEIKSGYSFNLSSIQNFDISVGKQGENNSEPLSRISLSRITESMTESNIIHLEAGNGPHIDLSYVNQIPTISIMTQKESPYGITLTHETIDKSVVGTININAIIKGKLEGDPISGINISDVNNISGHSKESTDIGLTISNISSIIGMSEKNPIGVSMSNVSSISGANLAYAKGLTMSNVASITGYVTDKGENSFSITGLSKIAMAENGVCEGLYVVLK